MNKVVLMGRLTKDPDIRYSTTKEDMCIARFTIAVDRRKKDDGADFISCIAFGKTAEFYNKYVRKGMKIAVTGRIQTGSYEGKDGKKVYTTDVVVEESEFCESKKENEKVREESKQEEQRYPGEKSAFDDIPGDIESELPFS